MIQSEVAARLAAATGERDYGSLSVLHRLAADVEPIARLGPERFFPQPKVESTFVRVWPRASGPLAEGELERVETLARAAFGQRRKVVTNGLARIAERRFAPLGKEGQREALESVLRTAGIDPRSRPERIEPEAWLALARAFEVAAPGTASDSQRDAEGESEREAEGGGDA